MKDSAVNKIFAKATKKAMVGWDTDLNSVEIINELWAWYLESEYIQRQFDELNEAQLVKFARRQAINKLSRDAKGRDLFSGKLSYSSESVKEALKGKSKNRYLNSILPRALKALDRQNDGYAEALRSRYIDGVKPACKTGQNALTRAHKALSEHVNIIALVASGATGDGPKLRLRGGMMDPGSVSGGGDYSDPTAGIALTLLANPALRDEYLGEDPFTEFLSSPTEIISLPDGVRYRLTREEERRVKATPGELFNIVGQVLGRTC